DGADRCAASAPAPLGSPRPACSNSRCATGPAARTALGPTTARNLAAPSLAVPLSRAPQPACQKITLDRQLADLDQQLLAHLLRVGLSALREDLRRFPRELFLPLSDHHRVDPEPPPDLGEALLLLRRQQRHPGLERRLKPLPILRLHVQPP